MATQQEIAQALRYGPQTQRLMRRSQYLEDYLKSSLQPEQPIRSTGELVARLAGVALANRASNKARDATLDALKTDRAAQATKIMEGLRPVAPQGAAPQMAPAMATPQPQAPIVPALGPAPQQPQAPAPQQAAYTPEDRDAFIRMLVTEAGGEPEEGIAAAGHVALNRAKSGYGGAKSLRDVVYAPNQFEGMSRAGQVKPEDYQRLAVVADRILSGQMPDPTGGAVNFLNPDLQVQMGRQIPEWARGQGQRIGRHVFFGGQPGQQQMAQALPPPPMPPDPNGPADQPAQPYQVAAVGQTPPPPSAPASSPAVAEAPPAAPPQAAAGGNPQWPTYQPSDAERGYAQQLLNDPATFEQGLAYAQKLREKMTQPAAAKIVEMNGVQFYVSETPGQGGQPVMIPIPQQAMTRNMPAEQAGVAAPRGTILAADPYNNIKPVIQPPTGQEVVSNPGEPYRERFVQGGENDPYRPQAPSQDYRYAPGGRQEAIPGSGADTRNPMNVMEGANRFGGMVKTVVDAAMKVKQNYGAVQAGFRQQNGTGDIAMINGLQKLIDDGVVKGEDVTMQMKSNGLEGTLGSYAQYLQSGGLLTPDVRQKVFATAGDLYQNLDNTYRVRVQSLAPGFDEMYGQGSFGKYVFPEAFASELGWTGERKPAPSEAPATASYPKPVAQAHQVMVQKGMYDANAKLGSEKRPYLARSDAEVRAFDKPENRGVHIITPEGKLVVID